MPYTVPASSAIVRPSEVAIDTTRTRQPPRLHGDVLKACLRAPGDDIWRLIGGHLRELIGGSVWLAICDLDDAGRTLRPWTVLAPQARHGGLVAALGAKPQELRLKLPRAGRRLLERGELVGPIAAPASGVAGLVTSVDRSALERLCGSHEGWLMGLGTADALAGALALLVPKGGLDGLREEVEILARLAGLTHTHQRTKATTARLQAQQQQLGERMRMLGELAPEVLHAVRNQLTVVIGFAGTIKDGALPAEGLREAGAEMEQAAQEASQLARQLGGLIRPRTEREQVLDLHAVIEAAAALLRQALGSRIEARLGLGAARSDVNATESRLLQVIIGLALRARDALPAGGIVEFRTSSAEPGGAAFEPPPGLSPNGCVRLRICARDRQLGNWAAASLSRADAPTRDELAAIRDMVEALGGVLAFDAEAGQGTVFEVFLPLVGPPAVASPRHEPDAPPKATGTVLVADDESSVRSVVRVMLSSADYRVLTAETGAQALETCASHADDIDVALVDLGLEDVDGLSCVAELRKQNPDLGTVLMSGRTLDDHQQEEMLAQGHVFLGKPFRKSTLVEAIERARQR